MIVLDTHTLLWMDSNDDLLGGGARRQIEDAWRTDGISVSAISFWEVAMLARSGRVVLPVAIEVWRADLLQAGVQEIPIDGRIALLAVSLHNFHKDPADRFIVATAIYHRASLLTADGRILECPVEFARQDARS